MNNPARHQWEKIGPQHHHGINIPLFSLRSKQSCGIGEYPDLLLLLPWCRKIGCDTLQLLPLNDSGRDSSPYNALSGMALNPIHLGLAHLPLIEKMVSQEELQRLQQLSNTQRIDYHLVRKEKEDFFRKYHAKVFPLFKEDPDYLAFVHNNPWLIPYSLFKTLKILNQWTPWNTWPPELKDPSPTSWSHLLKEYDREIEFHSFIQYLCFQQLTHVKKEAEKLGLFIKGDIPILIDRESADVWRHKNLFLLDYSAGAPPDMYSDEGQYWGFPLYNWEEMEEENYRWWKERLAFASQLYHIYRIDHIVGFYRIWGIPLDKPAKEGKFIPEDRSQWIPHGEKLMQMMLENSPMLPIGEDLGTVPPEVRVSLAKLGICGTKVLRWERNWNGDKSFIPPQQFIPLSMTTVSTHDSDTLQLWWKNSPEDAKDFAHFKKWINHPELTPDQQKEILWDSHHSGSLFHINLLNEYLALVPGMTWPLLEDEKINFPGTFSDRNWSYRFKPYVEEIISNPSLEQAMYEIMH